MLFISEIWTPLDFHISGGSGCLLCETAEQISMISAIKLLMVATFPEYD